MKRILRDTSGMALGAVLAIMAVISVLATGMFVFSYNELHFSQLDVNHAKADYLARAGVEVASKSFAEVAGNFPDLSDPVIMGPLYLYPDGGEDGLLRSSNDEEGEAGSVTVSIGEDVRTVVTLVNGAETNTDYTVWTYDATAVVGDSRATASGFSMPVAYVGDPDDAAAGVQSLDWVEISGNSCTLIQPPADGSVVVSAITGQQTIPVYHYAPYSGVVVAPETIGTLKMPTASGDKVYGWYASAFCFEGPIDLRQASVLNVFTLGASTVTFGGEIHLYVDNYQDRMGDLLLTTDDSCRVYFKENVYLHAGSTQIKLFDGGTAYQFGNDASGRQDIDLFQYAVDTGLVSTGLSGALRDAFAERQGAKYVADDLVELPDATTPTVNSMINVVWD